MKEYQVVSVEETLAWRHGEVCCNSPNVRIMGLADIMEIMLNRYAHYGWDVKKILKMSSYRVLIIFERSFVDSEEN